MSKLSGTDDEFGREGHQVDQENLWGYARGERGASMSDRISESEGIAGVG